MSNDPAEFLPVASGLVRQTLVETMFGEIEKRIDEPLPEAVAGALFTQDLILAGIGETLLDHDLRRYGYVARLVEAALFEPARSPAAWAQPGLDDRALVDTCAELARAEPVGKPDPDDALAMTWRVPGPGGHVRHYLARRTIEELLRDRETAVAGDPAELKRAWLYGFFVRVCEEVRPT